MNSDGDEAQVVAAKHNIELIIDAVLERGRDESNEVIDNYAVKISSYETRKLVTFQLYDSYFPPKRHEFELQILTSLVDAIAANPGASFLGGAVVGGVVGNAAYDVLKSLLKCITTKSKSIKRTKSAFVEIERNADLIVEFFAKRKKARIAEICDALDADPDRIEPLLKLMGFSSRKKGKHRVWIAPNSAKGTKGNKKP